MSYCWGQGRQFGFKSGEDIEDQFIYTYMYVFFMYVYNI